MPEPVAYYKVLNTDGSSCNGGTGRWPLPINGEAGAWLAVNPPLRRCDHGLHLCRREDLLEWLGPVIYRAEVHPEATRVDCYDKVVVSCARLRAKIDTWTERTARLFAADCGERALQHEQAAGREPDPRSWAAVQAARDYAEGRLDAAAMHAAMHAAKSVAESAMHAAWGVAESAAGRAGWCVAESVWAAAESAKSAADGAPESAAFDAAFGAALRASRGAAGGAAESAKTAEREWQTTRLWWYLDGEGVSHA